MEIGFIFWLLMFLILIFGWWGNWGGGQAYWGVGNGFLTFILLFILGWKVFGFAIHG
jgi:hypothetical protein